MATTPPVAEPPQAIFFCILNDSTVPFSMQVSVPLIHLSLGSAGAAAVPEDEGDGVAQPHISAMMKVKMMLVVFMGAK